MKIKQLAFLFYGISILFSSQKIIAQVGINDNNTTPALNSILDVKSANKGMYIPRMTTANRNALSGEGMVVFDTDTKTFWFHNGTNWVNNWVNSGINIYSGNSGNVGIGTNTPGAKLDVNGSLKLTDGNQGNSKVLTSDPTGLATWQNLPSASGFPLNIPEIVEWKGLYSSGTTYSTNSLVNSSVPDVYYYSLINGNLNNTPESSPSYWQAVNFYQLKQIYKPLPLVISQTTPLISFPETGFNFRGKITIKHTASATLNGLTLFSSESNFLIFKSGFNSGFSQNTDLNSKFGFNLNGMSSSPTISFSGSYTIGFVVNIVLGAGQTLTSNGIYYRVIPLGGQSGSETIPTIIRITP